jgi:hypothetical protein
MNLNDIKHIDNTTCYWKVGIGRFYLCTEDMSLARALKKELKPSATYSELDGRLVAVQFVVTRSDILKAKKLLKSLGSEKRQKEGIENE